MAISTETAAPLVVEQVPIDRLRPDPANPRRISEDELEALTRSLHQWGFVSPVLARREDSGTRSPRAGIGPPCPVRYAAV